MSFDSREPPLQLQRDTIIGPRSEATGDGNCAYRCAKLFFGARRSNPKHRHGLPPEASAEVARRTDYVASTTDRFLSWAFAAVKGKLFPKRRGPILLASLSPSRALPRDSSSEPGSQIMKTENWSVDRRQFLAAGAVAGAGLAAAAAPACWPPPRRNRCSRFRWPSGRCTRRCSTGKLDNLDFAKPSPRTSSASTPSSTSTSSSRTRPRDEKYLAELKKRGRRPGRDERADHVRRRGRPGRPRRRQADRRRSRTTTSGSRRPSSSAATRSASTPHSRRHATTSS